MRILFILLFLQVALFSTTPFIVDAQANSAQAAQKRLAEREDRDFIKSLFQNKKYNFALEEAKSYQKAYPKGLYQDEVLYIKAQIYMVKGREEKAISEYQKLIQLYPKSPYVEDSYFYAGILQVKAGQKKAGQKSLDTLKKNYPKSKYLAKSDYPLGEVAYQQENWPVAITHFQRVYENKKESDQLRLYALNYLSWSQLMVGERAAAEAGFRKLLRSKLPKELKAKVAFQMGVLETKKGRYNKAKKWFTKQRKEFSNPEYDRQSLFWMAEMVYLGLQKDKGSFTGPEIEGAVKIYGKNLNASNPYNPAETYFHRGWLYIQLGKPELAQADFTTLQELDQNYKEDINLNLLRADLYEESKDYQNTKEQLLLVRKNHHGIVDLQDIDFRILEMDFFLANCSDTLKRARELGKLADSQQRTSFHYYVGSCFYEGADYAQATRHYQEVSLTSKYGGKIFLAGLNSLQKQGKTKASSLWIEEGLRAGLKQDLKRVYRIKGQLHLKLQEWPRAVLAYEQLKGQFPEVEKNPWVHLEIAKSHAPLSKKGINRTFAKEEGVKSPATHRAEMLRAYALVNQTLPKGQDRVAVSILNTRIGHYQAAQNHKEVVKLYGELIPLIKSPKKQAQSSLELAEYYLYQMKNQNMAMKWLQGLHGKAARDTNIQASILLSELYIEQKAILKAAKTLEEITADLQKKNQTYVQVHFRKGEIYQSLEKWKKALRSYKMVLKAKGKHAETKEAKKRIKEIKAYLQRR